VSARKASKRGPKQAAIGVGPEGLADVSVMGLDEAAVLEPEL
jgi:hypothetical protein